MNNSHASNRGKRSDAESFWSGREFKITLGVPRNGEEVKEQNIVDELHALIKRDPEAINLLIALVGHYNARIYRLRFFLDHLADTFEGPMKPAEQAPEIAVISVEPVCDKGAKES